MRALGTSEVLMVKRETGLSDPEDEDKGEAAWALIHTQSILCVLTSLGQSQPAPEKR